MKHLKIFDNLTDDYQELIKRCGKNLSLIKIIQSVVENNNEILYYFDSSYSNWDVENDDSEGDFIVHNDDENLWEYSKLESSFIDYFGQYAYSKIELEDGKLLLIVDEEDYISMIVLDMENLQDGAVDSYYYS